MVSKDFQTTSSSAKSVKWARSMCFALIVILNLSTWIDLGSVWMEMPLMVITAPEGWTLPSTLSFIICLANIFPLIVIFLRWALGKRFSEIPFIYIIISIGIVACIWIGFFWQHTTVIFGAVRSTALIAGVFILAMLDCSSSLVYCDYMKRFRANYLNAMFIGESLTSGLPTILAFIQGVAGEAKCVKNNETSLIEPIYTQPRFSVSTFFFLTSGIIGGSLIAFIILRTTSIIRLAGADDKRMTTSDIVNPDTETCEMLFKGETKAKTSLPTPYSMSTKEFYIHQFFNVVASGLLYGCFPSIITYAILPYGQKAFYYNTILCQMSFPLAAVYGVFRPKIAVRWMIAGSIFSWPICAYIIIAAFQSPCPLGADTTLGGIVMIAAWFISSFILAYIRIASGNQIKTKWPKENGLFYFGTFVQLGTILGSLPMYIIINIFGLLKDRSPCVTYCL